MKLTPNTVRDWARYTKGTKGFVLNIRNGWSTAGQTEKNYAEHKKTWTPASFVGFVIAEVAEGAFGFRADQPLHFGSATGTIGLHCPDMLLEDEMRWLKEVLVRLGVNYFEITQVAVKGDEDALRVVAYCEVAYYYSLHRAQGARPEDVSLFEQGQFLAAAAACQIG